MVRKPLTVRLLGRTYCHLCHDMEKALQPLLNDYSVSLEIVDVDEFPVLEEAWGELVPVLLHGDIELCHYFLDENAVRSYFLKSAQGFDV